MTSLKVAAISASIISMGVSMYFSELRHSSLMRLKSSVVKITSYKSSNPLIIISLSFLVSIINFLTSLEPKKKIGLRKNSLMPNKKPEPVEIIRNKELVRHYQREIFRLNRQQRYLLTQLDKIKAQIKDYEKEKTKTEKWLQENG